MSMLSTTYLIARLDREIVHFDRLTRRANGETLESSAEAWDASAVHPNLGALADALP